MLSFYKPEKDWNPVEEFLYARAVAEVLLQRPNRALAQEG